MNETCMFCKAPATTTDGSFAVCQRHKDGIEPCKNAIHFPANRGFSDSASLVQDETDALQQSLARSISFGGHSSYIFEMLFKVKREYTPEYSENAPINDSAFNGALGLAMCLPDDIATPDIYVTPSGDVMFEWFENTRRVFSIMVGSNNKLSYAGLFGSDKFHGNSYLDDGYIPNQVIENIYRVYNSE